ncbi:hypothetical protein CC86DRAFT_409747 [Ophiobolus disseminans]|uniref:Uncharacterized protein n=1 Tax=Ophiobolus disseminans TaxID=1469910 RepID=A0A6A6ZQA5_9PLEO|nr:hypothetical protein CC86DRAFT_409747 [Ophiobolus disseminans]
MRLYTLMLLHAALAVAGLLDHVPTVLTRSPGGPMTIVEVRQALASPPYFPTAVGDCTWAIDKPMQSCFPWPHGKQNSTASSTAGGSSSKPTSSTGQATTPAPAPAPQHPSPAPNDSKISSGHCPAPVASASAGPAPGPAHPANTTSFSHTHSHKMGPHSTPAPEPQKPNLAPHDSNISSSHYSIPPVVRPIPKHNSTHHPIKGPSPVTGCTWVPDRPMQTCFPWAQHSNNTFHADVSGPPDPPVSFVILSKKTATVLVPRTFVTRIKRFA